MNPLKLTLLSATIALTLSACDNSSKYLTPKQGFVKLGKGWELHNLQQQMVEQCSKNFGSSCHGDYGFAYIYKNANNTFAYYCGGKGRIGGVEFVNEFEHNGEKIVAASVGSALSLLSKNNDDNYFYNNQANVPLSLQVNDKQIDENILINKNDMSNKEAQMIIENSLYNKGLNINIYVDKEKLKEKLKYKVKEHKYDDEYNDKYDDDHVLRGKRIDEIRENNKEYQSFKKQLKKLKIYEEKFINEFRFSSKKEQFDFLNQCFDELKQYIESNKSIINESMYNQLLSVQEDKNSVVNELLNDKPEYCSLFVSKSQEQKELCENIEFNKQALDKYSNSMEKLFNNYYTFILARLESIRISINTQYFDEKEKNYENNINKKTDELANEVFKYIHSHLEIPRVPKVKKFTNGSLCDFKEYKKSKYKVKVDNKTYQGY